MIHAPDRFVVRGASLGLDVETQAGHDDAIITIALFGRLGGFWGGACGRLLFVQHCSHTQPHFYPIHRYSQPHCQGFY